MFRSIVRIASFLLVALVVFGTLAGEGRVPIYQFPTTITQPGNYILTRNLVGPPVAPGLPMIDIQASDVDIDLNGFAMEYQGGTEMVIQALGQKSIAIRNGSILSGFIRVFDGEKIILEDLRINDPGEGNPAIDFDNVTSFAIRRIHVVRAGMEGIRINASNADNSVEGTIEDNHIEKSGTGIFVANGASVGILNNRIDQTQGGDAISLRNGNACMISHNTIASLDRALRNGIVLDTCLGCLISENTVYASAQDGIRLVGSRCCKLFNNIVHDVSGIGIALMSTDDGLVLDNVISESGGDGLMVDGMRNHLDRNVMTSNFGCGLNLGPASQHNTYGRNTARGNACACPMGGTSDFCNQGAGLPNSSFNDNYMPGLM